MLVRGQVDVGADGLLALAQFHRGQVALHLEDADHLAVLELAFVARHAYQLARRQRPLQRVVDLDVVVLLRLPGDLPPVRFFKHHHAPLRVKTRNFGVLAFGRLDGRVVAAKAHHVAQLVVLRLPGHRPGPALALEHGHLPLVL